MKKYILDFFKYLFYLRVSKLALVDSVSKVSPDASVFRGAKLFNSSIEAMSYGGASGILTHSTP